MPATTHIIAVTKATDALTTTNGAIQAFLSQKLATASPTTQNTSGVPVNDSA